MAAPIVAVSGAMAAAPAFMTAPQVHQALAKTSPHTVTARLDAVVQPAARTYTAQAGDTLYTIAQRYYGQGEYWRELYQANQSKISNPDVIYAGQVLTIPQRNEAVTASYPSTSYPSSAATAAAPQGGTGTQFSSGGTSTQFSSGGTGTQASSGGTGTQASSGGTGTQASSGSTGTQASSGGNSAVLSDIADGNNLLAIGQYLVDNGYSTAAAAGVASCVDGESMGNPESVGTGGGGLIGWTPISSAMPNPNIITGDVSQDMMTQLADLAYYNSNEIGQSLVGELNSQTDPIAAADFYSQNFEKPAVTDSDVVPSVAEQVFMELGG
jgi:LysM repeat protein